MAPVSMADIKYLRKFGDDLVVQGRDHAAAHIYIYIYCPFLYHHVLRSTFRDSKVYTKRNMTPIAVQKYLSQVTVAGWLRKYIPVGYQRTHSSSYIIHSSQSEEEISRSSTYYQLSILSF